MYLQFISDFLKPIERNEFFPEKRHTYLMKEDKGPCRFATIIGSLSQSRVTLKQNKIK